MTSVNIGPISGFPEWLPAERIREQEMLDIIRAGFESFGFCPIETPAVERNEVLTAKAGDAINRQIYSIGRLNTAAGLDDVSGLSLHFDLTVPLARYISQHFPELHFPVRRYQIQKVWRGERAQSGRFREFTQADIDIVGEDHLDLLNDAEIPAVIFDIFSRLDFGDFLIRVSNRKILSGFLESCSIPKDQTAPVLREVDRLERQGIARVTHGLVGLGMEQSAAESIVALAKISGDSADILSHLGKMNINEEFEQGVRELSSVITYARDFGLPEHALAIDLGIARGLDYYTGTVYETRLTEHPGIGSICSGGRYDDLAGLFTGRQFPGVGISIGVTRLFSRLLESGLIWATVAATAPILVAITDRDLVSEHISIARDLRKSGLNVELYTEAATIGRQLAYADRKGCSFVILPFMELLEQGQVRIRNLHTGDQAEVSLTNLAEHLKQQLGASVEA